MLPTKFLFIWPRSFREEYFFRNRPIRNKNCLWWPCLLTDRNLMSNLYRGPSKDASYQVSVHLVKRFQRRRFFFRNQPIRKKNCLWRPCLITDHNEMSNLQRTFHRCFLPGFGSFGQAVSEKKIFFKLANQKQELPVVAMFGNGS